MAILNITPDSFSDGGRFDTVETAFEQAKLCAEEGADILDLGAESTRPGHEPISVEEELSRLLPVLYKIKGWIDLPISVDTYKAEVAKAAFNHGASIINDVWGLQRDPAMPDTVAALGTDVIIMHNRFEGADESIDIFDDMDRWFDKALRDAEKAGIQKDKIILDPGIGFGKVFEQNLQVLNNLHCVTKYGTRTLMGLSRKRFLGAILDAEVGDRLFGTLTANITSLLAGIDIIRVHDVKPHFEALKVMQAIHQSKQTFGKPMV